MKDKNSCKKRKVQENTKVRLKCSSELSSCHNIYQKMIFFMVVVKDFVDSFRKTYLNTIFFMNKNLKRYFEIEFLLLEDKTNVH